MRLGARSHGASAATKAFTVAVMAVATFAQLLSLSHEMTVRHFRCAEHGEMTHLVALAPNAQVLPSRQAGAALRAQLPASSDAHEHCAVAFTVEGNASAPSSIGVVSVLAPPPVDFPAPAALVDRGDGRILTAAPKTSPPAAA